MFLIEIHQDGMWVEDYVVSNADSRDAVCEKIAEQLNLKPDIEGYWWNEDTRMELSWHDVPFASFPHEVDVTHLL